MRCLPVLESLALAGLVELFDCLLVVAKVLLAAHEDDRDPSRNGELQRSTAAVQFVSKSCSRTFSAAKPSQSYLFLNVIKRIRRVDGKA
jgi:hypothetical protein